MRFDIHAFPRFTRKSDSMSKKWLYAGILFFSLAATSISVNAQETGSATVPLTTDSAKASYGIGYQTGMRFGDIDLDLNAFVMGVKDGLGKVEPKLSETQIRTALKTVEDAARARFEARQKPLSDKNKKAGAEFVAKYKKVKGVKMMPNGIHYKVLTAGTGASPKPTDVVKVHYKGRLVDGKEFDSSYKRNEPAIFPLNQVIKGWTATVQKMKVGGKWQVVIPSDLAYGPAGSPPVIGPDAVLVFDIELLGIEGSGQ